MMQVKKLLHLLALLQLALVGVLVVLVVVLGVVVGLARQQVAAVVVA